MSHTLCCQYVHIIFVTKALQPLIINETRESLYGYVTGIVKDIGGQLIDRAGTSDHVHLLINIPTQCSISDFVCKLKACSSKWYRQKGLDYQGFAWEDGYSAFTVSSDSISRVKQYFSTEEKRHIASSYQKELISFLKIHDIKFIPQYLINTTHVRLFYHLVWAVKNRDSLLLPSIKLMLHERIRQEVKDHGGQLYAIENVADHIHLFGEFSRNQNIANLVQRLKTVTTGLINKAQQNKMGRFEWQEGYGSFSVGMPAFETVVQYVKNQEVHHSNHTFEQEWSEILTGHFGRSNV